MLRSQGVELIKVALTGYRLHIDGLFVMIAPIWRSPTSRCCPSVPEKLWEMKIQLLEIHHEDDSAIINCWRRHRDGGDARGRPGHTMDRLGLHGVEVLTIPYDKVISSAVAASIARRHR